MEVNTRISAKPSNALLPLQLENPVRTGGHSMSTPYCWERQFETLINKVTRLFSDVQYLLFLYHNSYTLIIFSHILYIKKSWIPYMC